MKSDHVLRSTLVVSACTALSRVLGFVREVTMAYFFGTSLAKSAFDVAFRIPNLFRRLFGEGALSAAFVPVFTATLERDGIREAEDLAGKAVTMLAVTLTAIVLAGFAIITCIVHAVQLGERPAAIMPLLGIMLPYMIFICLVALSMAILNSFRHFSVPAATPVILNVFWILSVFALCPLFGDTPSERIYGVAWGILAAGVVQLAVQVPVLRRHGIHIRPSWHWRDARVRAVLLAMAPTAIGMGVMQINVVIDGVLAMIVGPWAPAALTYAERLIYLPLGIFATSLGTVLLPTFSRQALQQRNGGMARTLGNSVAGLMLIVIPAAVGLLVLAAPITELAFAWRGGLFDSRSTVLTARALRFYAPGLITFSLYKLLLPLFYAQKDTRTPLRVGLVSVALNLTLNITFVLTWPNDYGHAGLACATVIASAFSCLWLALLARRRIGSIGWPRIAGVSLRAGLAAAAMAAAVLYTHAWANAALSRTPVPLKIVQGTSVGGAIIAGALVYGGIVSVLCKSMVRQLAQIIQRRRSA